MVAGTGCLYTEVMALPDNPGQSSPLHPSRSIWAQSVNFICLLLLHIYFLENILKDLIYKKSFF